MAIVSVLVAFSSLVVAEPAGAAKPVLVGTNGALCTMTGTVSYKPPLKTASARTVATVKADLTCSKGNTGEAVSIQSGKLTAVSDPYDGTCTYEFMSSLAATIKWKTPGRKVTSSVTTLAVGGGPSTSILRYFTDSVDTGSYQFEHAELTGSLSAPGCGTKKGVRKASLTGNVDVGRQCNSNILTGWGVAQVQNPARADDQHAWFVVAPFCDDPPANHPTGTMTWSYSEGPRDVCSGPINEPIVDSELSYAFTPWDRPPHPVEFTYWGVDLGSTVLDLNQCHGTLSVHYSGDSLFRAFTL